MRIHGVSPFLLTASLLGIGAVAACGPRERAATTEGWQAAYDTIGDTVVVRTLSGSVWGEEATLVPEISIGQLDGPEETTLGHVASLAMGRDGTIYALDDQVPALRVYNADGSYRATFGRHGEGPGEYKRPDGGLNVLSDGRILLRDPGNARIQVFSPEGEGLDTWRIRGGFSTSSQMVVDTRDRAYVMLLLDPEADVRDWEIGLLQVLPDGSLGDTLRRPDSGFEAPTIEARHVEGESTSASVNNVPYSPREVSVLSPRGYFIHGISTDYAFTLLKPGGATRIEKAYEPVPVASGERAEVEAFAVRNMRYTDPNWRWNGPPIPDRKPPYNNIFAGRDGTIWVQVAQPGVKGEDPLYDPTDPNALPDEWREPIVFDVFDEEGRYLGLARTPEGFRTSPEPLFTRDRVLATVRDELDVSRVVRFRVQIGATDGSAPGPRARDG